MSKTAMVMLLTAAMSCMGCGPVPGTRPISPVARPDTAQVHGDTTRERLRAPEEFWSDRMNLTLTRLSILQTYVQRFVAAHGRIPAAIQELRLIDPQGYDRVSIDGWGTFFQYEVEGVRYVLRSAGADLKHQTGDDLILGGIAQREEPCFIVRGNGRRIEYTPSC
jgi:hypothetical protein